MTTFEEPIRTYGEQRTELEKEIDARALVRVKKGLAWLEQTHGPGWEDKIDLSSFDLSSGSACVLGQVYADKVEVCDCGCGNFIGDGYMWAKEKWFPGNAVPGPEAEYGFNYDSEQECEDLESAWFYVLEPRISR